MFPIDPKIILAIALVLTIVEGIKALLRTPWGLWILKHIFKLDDIPQWFNVFLTGAVAFLVAAKGYVGDGVLTMEEITAMLEMIFGSNGAFLILRKLRRTEK